MPIHAPGHVLPRPSGTRRRRVRVAFAALAVLTAVAPASGQQSGTPGNLASREALRAFVADVAQRSPTFRRQCARIDATRGLIVRMRDAGPRGDRPYWARTVIRRHEFGAVTADVELYSPADQTETVAHEFEHLIEQIEGLNLQLMAFVAGSGVVRTDDGSFETRRAVLAGRRVAQECTGGGALVEPTY